MTLALLSLSLLAGFVSDTVAYGDDVKQRVDVVRKDEAQGLPVVVFLHGGVWQMGDRSQDKNVGYAFASRGFVAVTASYRLLGLPRAGNEEQQTRAAMAVARSMGEFPMSAPSPKGWPLTSDAWSGPDAVLSRIEWAKQLGERMPPSFDAMAAAQTGMGPLLRPATRSAMMRAQSPSDALALLVSSPEFQRR